MSIRQDLIVLNKIQSKNLVYGLIDPNTNLRKKIKTQSPYYGYIWSLV